MSLYLELVMVVQTKFAPVYIPDDRAFARSIDPSTSYPAEPGEIDEKRHDIR
ncbi:hypothetical protein EMCG_08970 [[Emmonsia] crescens]|uniref:Uncharacterized protein n=1 Tax=[Emmonsia] crescens TaxID=73230 RepID=A0A0G2I4L3_9EURO|nr:hypothetical protein EMCG_08970 [Emmonsia crescens UAMH 3008]